MISGKVYELVSKLEQHGFGNLDIKRLYGVFMIGLEMSAYSISDYQTLTSILPSGTKIGHYAELGSNLYINTNIPIGNGIFEKE